MWRNTGKHSPCRTGTPMGFGWQSVVFHFTGSEWMNRFRQRGVNPVHPHTTNYRKERTNRKAQSRGSNHASALHLKSLPPRRDVRIGYGELCVYLV